MASMLAPILREINEQFTLLNIVKADPNYQVYASGRVQAPKGSKKVIWSPEQWWEAFTFVFCCVGFDGGDDLLFFVRAPNYRNRGMRSYFVKRKQLDLPEDLQKGGSRFSKVDWCETVALNLVLQTHYQLDVAVCSTSFRDQVDIPGANLGKGSVRVSQEVFGSTTKANLSMRASPTSRKTKPDDCFPNICFAVHDHTSAFDSLIMTESDQSYVVILSAYGGPLSQSENPSEVRRDDNHSEMQQSESSESYVNVPGPNSLAGISLSPKEQTDNASDSWETPGDDLDGAASSAVPEPAGETVPSGEVPEKFSGADNNIESEEEGGACDLDREIEHEASSGEEVLDKSKPIQTSSSPGEPNVTRIRLFSGAVECESLREMMGKRDPFMKSRAIKMRGPGGDTVVDVIITCEGDDLVLPETTEHPSPLAALQHEMKGLTPKEMLQKGLGMAARAAKDKLARHSKTGSGVRPVVDLEGVPIHCSLMSMSLPLQRLAAEILNAAVPRPSAS